MECWAALRSLALGDEVVLEEADEEATDEALAERVGARWAGLTAELMVRDATAAEVILPTCCDCLSWFRQFAIDFGNFVMCRFLYF